MPSESEVRLAARPDRRRTPRACVVRVVRADGYSTYYNEESLTVARDVFAKRALEAKLGDVVTLAVDGEVIETHKQETL